jgi:hypothetical protein
MITRTLVMMAIGRIRSWLRPSQDAVRESPDPAPAPQAADAAPDAKTILPRKIAEVAARQNNHWQRHAFAAINALMSI